MGIKKETPSGWIPKEDGFFTADLPQTSTSASFTNFAEQSRARWNFMSWLRVKIHQKTAKGTPPAKA